MRNLRYTNKFAAIRFAVAVDSSTVSSGSRRKRTAARLGRVAESYAHYEAKSPMRPDVGTQPQFRKKKPPATYRYDSSLSPALSWDGQNPARELGEWLLARIQQAAALPSPQQSAAYILDSHPLVAAFVKNAGLGFAIPYVHNGQPHDYVPDFIVRLKLDPPVHLILETKGFDSLEEVKVAAAKRWVAAVNADGTFGAWRYELTKRISDIPALLAGAHS
jgi:type III restriction enzyme